MCNKICGRAHYGMKMMVVVLEEKEYMNWMKAKALKSFKTSFMPAPAAPTTPANSADSTSNKMI